LKKYSRFILLGIHTLALGFLPIAFLWVAPRFLPGDQLAPFLQYWAAYNVISLGFHGSVETLAPRILSTVGGVRRLAAISVFAMFLSVLALVVYLFWIDIEVAPETYLGLGIAIVLHLLHSAGRGSAMYKAQWGRFAGAAVAQSFVSILTVIFLFNFLAPRIVHIFIALAAGYIASIMVTITPWRVSKDLLLEVVNALRAIDKKSIIQYLGFSSSLFLVLFIPVLPIILGAQISLSRETLLMLTVIPYLVRIGSTVGNAFTPLVLSRYQLYPQKRISTFTFHAIAMTTPAMIALAATIALSPHLFEWYLGREVTLFISSVILISFAELLFSLSSVFRIFSLSIGGPAPQLFAWILAGVYLSWGLSQAPPTISLDVVADLLFRAALLLNLVLALALFLGRIHTRQGNPRPSS
jgi:hypothetical protein